MTGAATHEPQAVAAVLVVRVDVGVGGVALLSSRLLALGSVRAHVRAAHEPPNVESAWFDFVDRRLVLLPYLFELLLLIGL
mgnify:CR=1 FL=1